MINYRPLNSLSPQTEYSDNIPLKIRKHSEYNLSLNMCGFGREPRIQFDQTLLEFESVLPFSSGAMAEVTVSNPTPHPVELYSLDFDNQYIQEEEVSRRFSVDTLTP